MLVAGALLGLACLAVACTLWFLDCAEEGRYEALSAQAGLAAAADAPQEDGPLGVPEHGEGGVQGSTRDWDALRAANLDIAAWLTVGGTPIDYPVVAPGEDKPEDYYLTHDFWGGYSTVGCPFLEGSSLATGSHALVYGHHCGTTSKQFSPIADAYSQEAFEGLGACTWETPGAGSVELEPLCALSVDASYEFIQRYGFAGRGEFGEWLRALCEESSARASAWEQMCAKADRVVTLVTCTNILPGQAERTLVVFAA